MFYMKTDHPMLNRRRRAGTRDVHTTQTIVREDTSNLLDQEVTPHAPASGLSAAALAVVLLASFMVVLDFSIVNVGLPSIRSSLGFSGSSVQWVVTAYAISFSGLLILGGRIADLFGRRRSFVTGLLLFSAASLAAGMSTDAMTLIISRAVQGVGAAIVAPAALALITASIKEGPQRTRALGLYGATASIGFVAGQVLGGVFVQFMGWASIFLINVPVGIVVSLMAMRLISHDRPTGKIAHLDVAGAILATVSVAALVYAISEGTVLGWTAPLVVVALLVTLAGLASFVLVEQHHRHPLVDLSVLARPNLVAAGTLSLLMGAWNAGELVVLSLYLQQTLHDSPLVAGLIIAPQGVMGFVTGMFGSRIARRFGIGRLLTSATFATGLGFLLLMGLPTSGHYGPALIAVLLVGFGTVGTVFGTTVMAASNANNSEQGLVGGVVNTTRQIGAAVGVAVLVALAEGSHAASGTTTISGDRLAMLVAALIGFSGTIVTWCAVRSRATSPRTPAGSPTSPHASSVNAVSR
jgi:EmrB/QacA subfamily drug resistance transporter